MPNKILNLEMKSLMVCVFLFISFFPSHSQPPQITTFLSSRIKFLASAVLPSVAAFLIRLSFSWTCLIPSIASHINITFMYSRNNAIARAMCTIISCNSITNVHVDYNNAMGLDTMSGGTTRSVFMIIVCINRDARKKSLPHGHQNHTGKEKSDHKKAAADGGS
jgi:hypothetical protein